ncbi:putative hexokinase [Helianthus annuus]|nr:putative hexokinase [Helianthus annuus]
MGKVAVAAAVVGTAAVTAAVVLVVRHRMQNSGKWAKAMDIVKEFEEKCATPVSKLRQVADAMTVEMHAGLASDGGSKLKMLISYVDNLPTGFGIFDFFKIFKIWFELVVVGGVDFFYWSKIWVLHLS